MTYTDAKDTIINVIRDTVAMLNTYVKTDDVVPETVARFRNEIRGMLICLKNISSSNEFWCINYLGDCTEFGYYDENGQWVSVEK